MSPSAQLSWTPPAGWLRITAIDAHTGGEPLRVITSGFPALPGATILAKRRAAREQFDHLRRALMWEPRGHADMYGALLTEPVTPGAARKPCAHLPGRRPPPAARETLRSRPGRR